MDPAIIKLFLVQGSPNGLRTAELSNWSGKAIAAPRNELSALLKREELSNPGVYLLTGTDPKSGESALYIGEAEDVCSRLKTHASKDYWNAATVFVSKDENLTKSHIRYLEGKLLTIAKEVSASVLMNAASSGARLPEADTAEMDVFLQKMLQLLPVLGVADLVKSVEQGSDGSDVLYCRVKGVEARGKRTPGGFTVFAGSQAVIEDRPSAKRAKHKRQQLLEKGFLEAGSGSLRFTRDIEFGSPSTAATIVAGGAMNGLTAWKNAKGQPLKEIEDSI